MTINPEAKNDSEAKEKDLDGNEVRDELAVPLSHTYELASALMDRGIGDPFIVAGLVLVAADITAGPHDMRTPRTLAAHKRVFLQIAEQAFDKIVSIPVEDDEDDRDD